MLLKEYKSAHNDNRMGHEGDVVAARKYYYESKNQNLKFLLFNRFAWMQKYLKPGWKGVEVGAGIGVSKDILKSVSVTLTDFSDHPWLDVKNVDALQTPFENESFDFVVSSNMIHHVPYPARFFTEMNRILKPGGLLLIQEINASLFTRLVLRVMRHEGYSFKSNVFDPQEIVTDPKDLWSANCAIPNLLFDDLENFQKYFPFFKAIKSSHSEFFTFLDSGGVVAKTFYVPLPLFLLKALRLVDNILANLFPQIFALQRQIVLQKI